MTPCDRYRPNTQGLAEHKIMGDEKAHGRHGVSAYK